MKIAMLLAAGRGERFAEFTRTQPKALCRLQGKALIEHHIIRLATAGFTRIVINHAYLGGQIRQYLGNGAAWGVDIVYSPEPPGGLETGGGIKQALPFLGDTPFLVINADIFTDFDVELLQQETIDNALLVLVKKDPALQHPGDFGLHNGMPTNTNPQYTFAGIACYHPHIFAQCQQGRYSLTPLLRQLVNNQQAKAMLHEGMWFDVGSMQRLQAVRDYLGEGIFCKDCVDG